MGVSPSEIYHIITQAYAYYYASVQNDLCRQAGDPDEFCPCNKSAGASLPLRPDRRG
jgi:hypothetical protein